MITHGRKLKCPAFNFFFLTITILLVQRGAYPEPALAIPFPLLCTSWEGIKGLGVSLQGRGKLGTKPVYNIHGAGSLRSTWSWSCGEVGISNMVWSGSLKIVLLLLHVYVSVKGLICQKIKTKIKIWCDLSAKVVINGCGRNWEALWKLRLRKNSHNVPLV